MWSAVVVSVTAATSRTAYPRRPSPGVTTTAAAASEKSAWQTICWMSVRAPAGWMCRLVSSAQSNSAGRCRATTKSATVPRPGSAA